MDYLGKIIFKIHGLAKGLFFGLMITTSWMAYQVCESAIGGSGLPAIWESILIVAAAMIVTYMVDNALYEHAVAANAELIRQSKGNGWLGSLFSIFKAGGFSTLVLFTLMLGRFFFSGGATYLTGESTVATRQVKAIGTEDISNLQQQKSSAISAIRSAKQKQADKVIQAAQTQAAQIRKSTEELARRKVDVAIKQGSTTEQEAYKNGQWIRASYSKAIKKAEREAYRMEENAEKEARAILASAQKRYDAITSAMNEEVYKEENAETWTAMQSTIERKQNAAAILYQAERYTYYLIDFILVFGGFMCSWLVGLYCVKNKTSMDVFFPKTPGMLDVITDTFGSAYAYLVAQLARIPSYFKLHGSTHMSNVASSVAKSSEKYNAAVVKYLAASDPSLSVEHTAAVYEQERNKAQQKAQQKARQAQQRAQQQGEQASEAILHAAQQGKNEEPQQKQNNATESATGRNRSQQVATESATAEKSGGSFRSYLSRAGRYLNAGNIKKAEENLERAEQALPDDKNKARRSKAIAEIRQLIETAKN